MLTLASVLSALGRVSVGRKVEVVPSSMAPRSEEADDTSATVTVLVSTVFLQSVTVVGLSAVTTLGTTEMTVFAFVPTSVITEPTVTILVTVVLLQSVTVVGLLAVITLGTTEMTGFESVATSVVIGSIVPVVVAIAEAEEVGSEEANVILTSVLTNAAEDVSVQVQSVVSVDVDVSVMVIKSLARRDIERFVITATLSSWHRGTCWCSAGAGSEAIRAPEYCSNPSMTSTSRRCMLIEGNSKEKSFAWLLCIYTIRSHHWP